MGQHTSLLLYLQDIQKDQSAGKQNSHGRLPRFVERFDQDSVVRAYSKPNLCALCRAYPISVTSRATKKVLALQLMQAIRTNASIPLSEHLNERSYTVTSLAIVGEGQGIVMRLHAN